jgi:paraquat-inducible protein B
MSKKANTTLIGIFVIGALALALIMLVLFGSGRFFRKTHRYILYFAGDVNGLNIGAPVKFKGVTIGEVTKILIRFDQNNDDVHIPVIIEIDEQTIRNAGLQIDYKNRNFMKNAVKEGLRGQLATQSMVTGLLYIHLDFHEDQPAHWISQSKEVEEIPTIPTSFEEAREVFKQAMAVFDPQSPLLYQMRKTLEEVADAARSVHTLTDYLERNPNAVLTGRSLKRSQP